MTYTHVSSAENQALTSKHTISKFHFFGSGGADPFAPALFSHLTPIVPKLRACPAAGCIAKTTGLLQRRVAETGRASAIRRVERSGSAVRIEAIVRFSGVLGKSEE